MLFVFKVWRAEGTAGGLFEWESWENLGVFHCNSARICAHIRQLPSQSATVLIKIRVTINRNISISENLNAKNHIWSSWSEVGEFTILRSQETEQELLDEQYSTTVSVFI